MEKEKIMGIDKLRPDIGSVLDKIKGTDQAIIVSRRSEPKGALIDYNYYKRLLELAKKAKQLEIEKQVSVFRQRAQEAGLTEEEAVKEVKKAREENK